MDKKSTIKLKKGKSSYEELPQIPDYERPKLEKFERGEYEYSKDDESTRDSSLKSDDEDQESMNESLNKNTKLKKSKAHSETNDNSLKPQKEDGMQLQDRKKIKIENTKKSSDNTKKSIGESKDESPETDDDVDETVSQQGSTCRRKQDDEQQDYKKVDTPKKSDIEVSKKPKKKIGKSTYDLPEIPDYERPELEKFDRDDHEFSWEGNEPANLQDDSEMSDSLKISKSAESQKHEEPSSKNKTSKSDEEKLIEKVQQSKKQPKREILPDDDKNQELKLSQKKTDEQKLPKSSKPSLTSKQNTEELGKIPDGDKNELEKFVESDFDPAKKSRIKKLEQTEDILTEIPENKKPELGQFDRKAHELSKNEGLIDKKVSKQRKHEKDVEMASETIENPTNENTRSSKSQNNSKKTLTLESKVEKGLYPKSLIEVNKSLDNDESTPLNQTEKQKQEDKKSQPRLVGKDKDDDGLAKTIDNSKIETDLEPSKRQKSKKPANSDLDDLPKISDYETPTLEKFDRDDHDFGNQDVEMSEADNQSSKPFTKDSSLNNLGKGKPTLQSNQKFNASDKSKDNQKESKKEAPQKRTEFKNEPETEVKSIDLKSNKKLEVDAKPASHESKSKGIKPKSNIDNLPKIADDNRPDLEKYTKSDFNPTKSPKDKNEEEFKPEDKSKISDVKKPESDKFERLDTSRPQKSKEDDKSWSGKLKPKDDDASKGSDLTPFNKSGKNGQEKSNPFSKEEDENSSLRKLSLDKTSANNETSPDDAQRKLSFENKTPEELTANERYLMRRLNKKLSPTNSSSDVTIEAPRKDPSKSSSEAKSASDEVRTKSRSTPVSEESTSKNIELKEPREVPIEIMITEPESPTDKKGLKINEKITKPGPRNPRYDPLAFVPEDEELPLQPKTFPTPTTPTSPYSPNKPTYNPFQYDLDEDEETPDEQVNTHNKLCNLKI